MDHPVDSTRDPIDSTLRECVSEKMYQIQHKKKLLTKTVNPEII